MTVVESSHENEDFIDCLDWGEVKGGMYICKTNPNESFVNRIYFQIINNKNRRVRWDITEQRKMKKLVLMLAFVFAASIISVAAQPKLDGVTFRSKDGTTLDFYSTRVIYHYDGIARNCDWRTELLGKTGKSSNGSIYTWKVIIEIPLSNRIQTLVGYIEVYEDGTIKGDMNIDGNIWKKQ